MKKSPTTGIAHVDSLFRVLLVTAVIFS